MASKLSIWNRALQKGGSEQLVSATADNKRSRALDLCYEPIRDSLLEQFPWGFAKKLVNLAADGQYTPEWKYANQYPLPSDCLAVVEVDTTASYEVMLPKSDPFDPATTPSRAAILTDHTGTLPVLYIARVTNEEIYSPLFCELLSTMLAHATCEELTQSNQKKQDLADEIKSLNRQAKATASKQRTPTEMQDGSWWEARN